MKLLESPLDQHSKSKSSLSLSYQMPRTHSKCQRNLLRKKKAYLLSHRRNHLLTHTLLRKLDTSKAISNTSPSINIRTWWTMSRTITNIISQVKIGSQFNLTTLRISLRTSISTSTSPTNPSSIHSKTSILISSPNKKKLNMCRKKNQ